jgi:uncharacterized protein (DUF433 family)
MWNKHNGMIQSDPRIMLGKPVITGTRITVELILEQLADGIAFEQIVNSYSRLSTEAIESALLFAVDFLSSEIVYPINKTMLMMGEPFITDGYIALESVLRELAIDGDISQTSVNAKIVQSSLNCTAKALSLWTPRLENRFFVIKEKPFVSNACIPLRLIIEKLAEKDYIDQIPKTQWTPKAIKALFTFAEEVLSSKISYPINRYIMMIGEPFIMDVGIADKIDKGETLDQILESNPKLVIKIIRLSLAFAMKMTGFNDTYEVAHEISR